MTDYRALEDWEKKRYENVEKDCLEKIEFMEWSIEERQRKIDKVLRLQYQAGLKTARDEIKQIHSALNEEQFILKDAQEKLKYGAPIKEEETTTHIGDPKE